jgi:glycerol kinase
MAPQYILALDQGTTSSRSILFNAQGIPISQSQREFPQIYPSPGHVEHDPEAIWASQIDTARTAMLKVNAYAEDIVGIGITNQRETTILWDRISGHPVANAIVWQSRITEPLCEELRARGLADSIHEKTGLIIDAYFSATKIVWLLDKIPGLRARAESGEILFGTIDTFLIWRLSGGKIHATDYSNASRTMIFNIHTLDWDDDLLRELNIPSTILPRVLPSSMIYGMTDPSIFGSSIPLAGIAGDQQAATFGQACFEPGMVKNTYGTGIFMMLNTGTQPVDSHHGLLTTIAWGLGHVSSPQITYALEGSIFIGGAAVQWLRDGLCVIPTSAAVETQAMQVPDTGGVYMVPAFVGLGAPYWDAKARGAILGITRGTTVAHIARATIESMAYQTRDVLDAMSADTAAIGLNLHTLRVDGGASVNDILMQFQSDILGFSVDRPYVTETTALGAAYLAGLATGFLPDRDAITRQWALERRFNPMMSLDERERTYSGWRKAVARCLNWED